MGPGLLRPALSLPSIHPTSGSGLSRLLSAAPRHQPPASPPRGSSTRGRRPRLLRHRSASLRDLPSTISLLSESRRSTSESVSDRPAPAFRCARPPARWPRHLPRRLAGVASEAREPSPAPKAWRHVHHRLARGRQPPRRAYPTTASPEPNPARGSARPALEGPEPKRSCRS